jgi:glutathione S-transferase
MRLYHHPMSSNARRASMTALHLGANVELVAVDLGKREQRAPEFLKLNPNGRIPVLVDGDGDFVLTESHAIMQYLAEGTPGQTLYPAERRARADVNRWLFWSAHHFQPAVSVLVRERVIKPMIYKAGADPVEEKRGEDLLADCARVLDGHLAGKDWVAGSGLTLADIALATPLAYLESARLPLTEHRNIQRWFSAVRELDAWKKTGM